MAVKGIFFDLYGTLFTYGDMQAGVVEWLSEFHACLRKHGLSISEESFVNYYHNRLSGVEVPRRDDDLTLFERRIQIACSDLRINVAVSDIRHIATDILNVWNRYVFQDPNCMPVLETLRQQHIILGLISNFDHPPHVRALVRNSGLDTFLATVVVSGDTGVKKPDSMIFDLALMETGLRGEDTIYVGDAEEDVVGANNAGMVSVLIDRNGHGKNYGQTHTIKSLRDILRFV